VSRCPGTRPVETITERGSPAGRHRPSRDRPQVAAAVGSARETLFLGLNDHPRASGLRAGSCGEIYSHGEGVAGGGDLGQPGVDYPEADQARLRHALSQVFVDNGDGRAG
jgi:hypothetical protein